MSKRSASTSSGDSDAAKIKAIVAGQSKPVTHPGATYEMAYRTQDAQANGVGRRLDGKR